MKSGHSFWVKIRQNSDVIDIQALLKHYWDSTEHEFTIPSQLRLRLVSAFLMEKHRGRCHWKLQWSFGVAILYTHYSP